jgi:hypothetical protein
MPDDLDRTLAELRRNLSNAQLMGNTIVALRDNTTRLGEPFREILQETRDAIDRILPLLP